MSSIAYQILGAYLPSNISLNVQVGRLPEQFALARAVSDVLQEADTCVEGNFMAKWYPRNTTYYTPAECPSPCPSGGLFPACPGAVPGNMDNFHTWELMMKLLRATEAEVRAAGTSCYFRASDAVFFDSSLPLCAQDPTNKKGCPRTFRAMTEDDYMSNLNALIEGLRYVFAGKPPAASRRGSKFTVYRKPM